MKKIIIALPALLLWSSTLDAQQRAQIGLKGGVNFSYLHTHDAADMSMLAGFNNGFFVRMPLVRRWSFQPEIYYITKGADITYNSPVADGTARYKFSYIEMPLMLVAHITPRFNIQAGPYIAFLLDSEVKNQSDVYLFNYREHIQTSDFNRLDAGIVLGLGFDIGAFGIGARYSYGLIKTGKERDLSGKMYRFPDAGNSSVITYISYSFSQRRKPAIAD
jgi:hypothetical protein